MDGGETIVLRDDAVKRALRDDAVKRALRDDAVEWLVSDGLTAYPDALAAMRQRAAAIRAGAAAQAVWLVEHPPLFTAGTSAAAGDISNPAGFPTYDAGRGGQWTYHGPGQRLGYVMLDLQQAHGSATPRDVRRYVWCLEEWLIRTLAAMNVRGERRPGRVGIWVARDGAEAKIAAIGVRVTRWVSWHGVSLNIAPDLAHFAGIVPCGIREHGVTSLEQLGITATMAEVDTMLRTAWGEVFGA